MVEFTTMSTTAADQVLQSIDEDVPPWRRERRLFMAKTFLRQMPELGREMEEEGALRHARSALRHVLARRGLPLAADEEARIDACTDLATLDGWLGNAVVAPTASEALGPALAAHPAEAETGER
jgi:hypothetical protein